MGYEIVQRCPVCQGAQFQPFLVCKDFTTSGEDFSIAQCKSCSFLLTSPRPDKDSLARYYDSEKYISHTGGSKGFMDVLYVQIRRFALRWKLNLIKKSKAIGSVLDFGCGTGEFLNACQQKGWTIAGIEPADKARAKAQNLTHTAIHPQIADLGNQEFDIITLWHVLEHVADLSKTITELASRLKPAGTIFIAVPNHECFDSQFYKNFWAGYDVPRHVWHFSPSTMSLLLNPLGLQVKEIIPMKQDAFYVSLLSEKYKHPNRSIWRVGFAALLRGFQSNRAARKQNNYSSLVYRLQP